MDLVRSHGITLCQICTYEPVELFYAESKEVLQLHEERNVNRRRHIDSTLINKSQLNFLDCFSALDGIRSFHHFSNQSVLEQFNVGVHQDLPHIIPVTYDFFS